MESRSGRRRDVIAEKKAPMHAFSHEGIRGDVLAAVLALALMLFIGLLVLDLNALYTRGNEIGTLNAEITGLKEDTFYLRETVSSARAWADSYVLRKDEEPVMTVVLSPVPEE